MSTQTAQVTTVATMPLGGVATMQEAINASTDATVKKYLMGVEAAAAWNRVTSLKSGAGASIATRLLGKVAGFSKGHSAKAALALLGSFNPVAVLTAIDVEENKKMGLVQEDYDAGIITTEQATDKQAKLMESYANARAWANTLDLPKFIADVSFIREHRNTINITLKTSKAVGARITVTIDETLSEFLGKPVKNMDIAKACAQGLARFE